MGDHIENPDKEQLICGTLLDMMEEKSCFNIKVTDLVKRAGISRSSFYVYFDSILDVVNRIETDYIAGLPDVSTTAEITSASFRYGERQLDKELELSYWNYVKDNMRTYQILTGQNGEPLFRRRLENRFKRISLSIIEQIVPDANPLESEVVASYLAGARMSIFDWWAFHSEEIDAETIQRLTSRLYWKTFDVALTDVLETRKR